MFKKIAVLICGLALSLSACAGGTPLPQNKPLTSIRLPVGYIPNIQFAPLYAAIEKGYFREAGIEVEFDYSFETDGVKLVGAGELPFAVASGEQVLLARAQGVPVTYVAAWYQKYPISVVARRDQGISSPQDLKGKSVGLPGLFGANYIGLRALLFSAGLDEADVNLESVGFNQVEVFAAGRQQAIVGYTANEPIQLKAQGFDISELRVADYVQLASNGILAGEKVIAEDPALVRAFVTAFLKGMQYAIERPDEVYALSAKHIPNFSELDETVQKQILAASIELWKAERLGYSDPQAWENMK
ncbi:MAG: ABC transporter substrate-binding protein, partial [Chloroflexi bacterium]|nr:ABC transporter substrate-binding protein [Chloroflexota bacterium]